MVWLRPSGALLRSLSRCKDSEEERSTVPFAPKYLAKGRFFPSILLHPYLAKGGGEKGELWGGGRAFSEESKIRSAEDLRIY